MIADANNTHEELSSPSNEETATEYQNSQSVLNDSSNVNQESDFNKNNKSVDEQKKEKAATNETKLGKSRQLPTCSQ